MALKLYELCGADNNNLFSPHCWKLRLAVEHKGLEYEVIPTPFTAIAGTEGGPKRTVPVMRDGDTVMHESFAIAKYLEETYPDRPSLFGGAGGEAMTEFVIQWSQRNVHPAVVKLCLMDIYNGLAPADQAFFRETREKVFGMTLEEFDAKFPKDSKDLTAALAPLEAVLKKQPYLGGESPVFADYVVFGPLQWLRVVTTRDVGPEGAVAEWFDRLLDMYDGVGRKAITARAA